MAISTTNFLPADGNWKTELRAIKASTALAGGTALSDEIVSNTTTGYLTSSPVANASGANFAGILAETVAATDADYATAGKKKLVWVPLNKKAKAYFTVGAGTFTSIDVGKTVQIYTGAKTLAVDTAGLGAKITDYISSTRGKCQFTMPDSQTA